MTMKQCNSCKWHIYVKGLTSKSIIESCYLLCKEFYKNENCPSYHHGEINQGHKETFERAGKEYPFIELE